MKVAHWSLMNGSGLCNVAKELVEAERALGLDSVVIDSLVFDEWGKGMDADVHVCHSAVPDQMRASGKVVWIGHGTPEHCFAISTADGATSNTTHSGQDSWHMSLYYCMEADAVVTFWPRHAKIWQNFRKRDAVKVVPLGVNKSFWQKVPSKNAIVGTPACFFAENSHQIKWALDLLLHWRRVVEQVSTAKLTLAMLPMNQMRWWSSLIAAAGLPPYAYIATGSFDHNAIRLIASDPNVFHLSLVRYGDFNKLCLETAASGGRVISYHGNPYASFWLTENDNDAMVKELVDIFNGVTQPREAMEVPDISVTAMAMKEIYESL